MDFYIRVMDIVIDVYLQMNFDVFNALDLMNNKEFLEKLKFGIGDGNLQYYLYNWKCPAMDPKRVQTKIIFTFLLRSIMKCLEHFELYNES